MYNSISYTNGYPLNESKRNQTALGSKWCCASFEQAGYAGKYLMLGLFDKDQEEEIKAIIMSLKHIKM